MPLTGIKWASVETGGYTSQKICYTIQKYGYTLQKKYYIINLKDILAKGYMQG